MRRGVCLALNALNSSDFAETREPFALLTVWLGEGGEREVNDPEAMTLATVDASGLPDTRMVLCKRRDEHGLVFYTNTESAKGRELAAAPKAAALFHWKSLRRQVRLRGAVATVAGRRGGRLFRHPAAPQPDRRLGEPAVAAARVAR